jgi:hypothetical protein
MRHHRRIVQITVIETADPRTCVLVAELSTECARWRASAGIRAADDARLLDDQFTVLLVKKTNGLRREAVAANNAHSRAAAWEEAAVEQARVAQPPSAM